MQDILLVWAETFLRWTHVIAGVAWIGSSFYFMHLDYSLKQRPGLPDRAYGEAWQVHGGGFYHVEKYTVAPATLPEVLHWFKWEAYWTWFTGFALLGCTVAPGFDYADYRSASRAELTARWPRFAGEIKTLTPRGEGATASSGTRSGR
mgnify:CR=1 FL=1